MPRKRPANRSRLGRKRRLWHQDPHCIYCGVLTILARETDIPPAHRGMLATLEHVRSRFDPLRRTARSNMPSEQNVLACLACNEARGRKEDREFTGHRLRLSRQLQTWWKTRA